MAEVNPEGYWPWVYTKERLHELAVETALRVTTTVESQRAKLGDAKVNQYLAMREGWLVLVEDMQRDSIKRDIKNQHRSETRKKAKNEADDSRRRP